MSSAVHGRLAWLALLGALALGAAAGAVSRGDAAWAERARGAIDGRPLSGPIRESIEAYQEALGRRPDSLPARWKLLRSLHFAGTFVTGDPAEGRRTFQRATRISEEGIAILARQAGGGTPLDELPLDSLAARLEAAAIPADDVARLYFWSAISWGAWSRTVGLLSAVRRGAADRLHRYALVTLELEPAYEEGGAYRLLGRLHATLPRVPFLSGWVDRKRAIPLVEQGYALAPQHPGNGLLLALTLLELAPERRDEALTLLERVEALPPREDMRIEDRAIREEARERRAELGGPAPRT